MHFFSSKIQDLFFCLNLSLGWAAPNNHCHLIAIWLVQMNSTKNMHSNWMCNCTSVSRRVNYMHLLFVLICPNVNRIISLIAHFFDANKHTHSYTHIHKMSDMKTICDVKRSSCLDLVSLVFLFFWFICKFSSYNQSANIFD